MHLSHIPQCTIQDRNVLISVQIIDINVKLGPPRRAFTVVTMMMSSNGNIFRFTGHLWGESTGHRWIPLTKARDAEFSFMCAWTNV